MRDSGAVLGGNVNRSAALSRLEQDSSREGVAVPFTIGGGLTVEEERKHAGISRKDELIARIQARQATLRKSQFQTGLKNKTEAELQGILDNLEVSTAQQARQNTAAVQLAKALLRESGNKRDRVL